MYIDERRNIPIKLPTISIVAASEFVPISSGILFGINSNFDAKYLFKEMLIKVK